MKVPVEPLRVVLDCETGLTLAVLFGSSARGCAGPASDVDIGVLYEQGVAPASLQTLGVRLERAVGRQVDLVWLNTAPPLVRFEVARDGELLIERSPHAWSAFRAKAMIDWWDWAPTARMMYAAAAERARASVANSSPPGGGAEYGPA